jgi:hypothetical protein
LTYASLNAEFRLRVIKTEAVYLEAKAFWDTYCVPAFEDPGTSAQVYEYGELLALLLNNYEAEQENEKWERDQE